MKCSRWEKFIALYIEGDLPEQNVRLVEKHLLTCPACLDFSETLKESQRHVRSLHNESLNEAVYQEMRNRVMNEIASGTLIQHRRAIAGVLGKWHWKPLVAGALLMLLVVFTMWRRHTPDEVSLPIASNEVDGKFAQVTPKEDLARKGQKLVDGQVILQTAPLEAKKPKFSKQAIAILHSQSGPPTFRFAHSQPGDANLKQKEISSPLPEPLYIELATGDPDVLIVWSIEPNRGEK